ncbi:MAG: serine hydrolase [Candidatus Marinimicrobia bacterium]|nr:serine hydrolase [Candidatus Neomarinimicrobiota bacterium]MEC7871561.1 serine hydrolase domain-containing protein [Candidatus Neomarinimicrobiota bacterium]MEC9006543.1 serine hydrolase domain-containing protein [Candidatus Neomarinimicrobiota bacterium]
MKISNLKSLIVLLGFTVSLIFGQPFRNVKPESVGLSSNRLKRLTDELDAYVADQKLPGGVALVLRKGKSAYFYSFGYRDKELMDPMEKDDIFRIASQTKAIISVGIMILQEKGLLLIQDPVSKYIEEFENTKVAESDGDGSYEIVKAKRGITIRDLLTHTAGVGWGFGPAKDLWEREEIMGWYFAHRDETIQTTVKRLAKLPMDSHPGEKFVYGLSTDILGAVIEVVSGQSLDQFLKNEIFDPLQMNDTHFYLPLSKIDRLTKVYSSTDSNIKLAANPGKREGVGMIGQGHYVNGPRMSFSGGAGLLSTAEDYAVFLQMMLNKGQFGKKRILSRKSVELMVTNHIADIPFWWEGIRFGLGFATVEELGGRGMLGSVGEFSWGGAYHSTYWVDPNEDMVVVYFTQLLPAINIDDHSKLRTLIYQSIID